jgi:hypothetical protein
MNAMDYMELLELAELGLRELHNRYRTLQNLRSHEKASPADVHNAWDAYSCAATVMVRARAVIRAEETI